MTDAPGTLLQDPQGCLVQTRHTLAQGWWHHRSAASASIQRMALAQPHCPFSQYLEPLLENMDLTVLRALLGWRAQRGLAQMCEDSWRWQRLNPQGFDAA